jgi:predicted GNAT superfamily acetyltransferase
MAPVDPASRQANDAAARAGVEVRTLTSGAELEAAAELLTDLWQTPFSEHVLRALEISGNYVAGAFAPDGFLIGASVGWAAITRNPELHSHVSGVAQGQRRSGVGVALKLHQRSWALQHGIGTITWTFDPLVKRNAVFNLARLGASAQGYLENIYGVMADAMNLGESDRLWVRWELADPAVDAAASGTLRRAPQGDGATERLWPGPEGEPVEASAPDDQVAVFICRVHPDIESLRRRDPDVADAWRRAIRRVMGGTLEAGGRVLGLDENGDYVIETRGAA